MNRTTAWAPVVLGAITLAVVALLVLAFWPRDADTPPGTPSQRTDDSTASTEVSSPSSSGDAAHATTNGPATNIPPRKRPVPSRTPSPPKEGSVFGIVSDSGGNPVPGASISLRISSGGQTRTTTADSDGLYRISHPRPGIALLEAQGPDPTDGFARGSVELAVGSEVGWDPVLETKHAIFGTVTDDVGVPLPSFRVSATSRFEKREVTTDASGRFMIHPCRDEPHDLVAIGTVEATSKQKSSDLGDEEELGSTRIRRIESVDPGPYPIAIVIAREPERTCEVVGRLVPPGDRSPFEYALRLVLDDVLRMTASYEQAIPIDAIPEAIRLEPDGSFRSGPLEPQRYRLWITCDDSFLPWEAAVFTAPRGEIVDLGDLQVPAPGSIEIVFVGGAGSVEPGGVNIWPISATGEGTRAINEPCALGAFEEMSFDDRGNDRVVLVAPLQAGDYMLQASMTADTGPDYSGEQRVTIDAGATSRISWQPNSGHGVYWRIYESGTRNPSSTVRATVFAPDGGTVLRSFDESKAGDYSWRSGDFGGPFEFHLRLPKGTYPFEVSTDTGYAARGTFDVEPSGGFVETLLR